MENETVKLVVFVPETHAEKVREVLGQEGAGAVGDYAYCSFSTKGISRFIPQEGANPTIGEVGKMEEVIEEKIETVCNRKDLERIIAAVKKVHPYEEVAIDVYPLLLDPHRITYNN